MTYKSSVVARVKEPNGMDMVQMVPMGARKESASARLATWNVTLMSLMVRMIEALLLSMLFSKPQRKSSIKRLESV